jgi:hypothetical protein
LIEIKGGLLLLGLGFVSTQKKKRKEKKREKKYERKQLGAS